MSKPENIKLQKGQKLHFLSRDEFEEIVKSSNNRETGMIRAFSPKKRMNRDYSVNFILTSIENGMIKLITQ